MRSSIASNSPGPSTFCLHVLDETLRDQLADPPLCARAPALTRRRRRVPPEALDRVEQLGKRRVQSSLRS